MSRVRKPKLYPEPKRCNGKVCYPSKHEAELVREQQELLNQDLELNVYRCHLCGQWHLTRSVTPRSDIIS